MSKGNSEAQFKKIYTQYVDEIYQYVFLRTGLNAEIAEDLTQDIFLNVFKGLKQFKGLCSERTWVFKITKNKINDFYRKHYRQGLEPLPIEDEGIMQISDPQQDISTFMDKVLTREDIVDCLNQLPEHYKLVLLLKYIDGRSVKEIAMMTNKSTKAIENILLRAKGSFIKAYQTFKMEETQ
ncbi:RNA polymerase sigma factor [Acetobacterium woodii]|uniref:RNA polymerase ECF-like sigma factor n=1 Tax=Acetobacterium woodii (strain ATCC 29683 / DSM 1030 / JCM 2381 / KCTC 1655 / WB1) TaxID=931626 RepID=H6LIF4_ACEWD|nr:RNA polymerase sigma factor [Acetobacterium woodii]AFA47328.1 RNA polymerase ECF-like sigma factor [Acetobacterium woodii DSM 1030]